MKKLGKCYLDEIVLNDSILFGSGEPKKWIEPYEWLNDEICTSVIELFPNTDCMSSTRILSEVRHLLSHFYGQQLAFKQASLSGDRQSCAKVMRKECEKIYEVYIDSSTDTLVEKRHFIKGKLMESSKMTRNFLGFLSTTAFGMDRPKPHKITKNPKDDEAFLGLGEILEAAIYVCNENTNPGGGGKPVYKQMTLAAADFFLKAVGTRPTRVVNHYADKPENYALLKIVQRMAYIIEANLPPHLREEKHPNLQKACRQMIGRIREENEVE